MSTNKTEQTTLTAEKQQDNAPESGAKSAVRTVDLVKIYGKGEAAVHALAGVTTSFYQGEITAIMGPSGSGKSTMMHCIGGLDAPTSGSCFLGDKEITGLSRKQSAIMRRDSVGFIFQSFNLLPTLTAQANIELPLKLAGKKVDTEWLKHLAEVLGIEERLGHRPSELSGGQQQRVAAARALITRPTVILADEPTGALDSASGKAMLEFLRRSVDELGQTIIMVTHDDKVAETADRVVHMRDGQIVNDVRKGA